MLPKGNICQKRVKVLENFFSFAKMEVLFIYSSIIANITENKKMTKIINSSREKV